MTERELTTQIINEIYKHGNTSLALKYHGGPTTIKGLPDIFGAFQGVPFAVEIKLPGKENTLTLIQRAYLGAFSRGGYVTGVVTSWDEFEKLFDKNEKMLYPDFKRKE